MAKKTVKVAVTYFITLIITLAVFGGIGYYLFNKLMNTPPKTSKTDDITVEQGEIKDIYTPSQNDRQTLLIAIDLEDRLSGSCFVIARLLPVERKIMLMTVPSDTYANVDGIENSIFEFYRTEGIKKAVQAVETSTKIPIDKFLKLNKESFATFADIFSGVDYNAPYNLIYENPNGEDTIIREGIVHAESDTMMKILSFPNFKAGDEYRAKVCSLILTDLINKNIVSGFSENIDDYFSAIINSDIDTDVTSYDYEQHSTAIKYVAASTDKIAENVIASGVYDDYGRFVLDENFIKSLTEWFKLYDYDENNSIIQ